MTSIPFYETPNGQTLLCEANYPLDIKSYLRAEKLYVDTISSQYSHIVEIGCIDGRYSYLARESGKRYTGVDLNIRTIEKGQATNHNSNSILVHQAALPFLIEYAPTFTPATLVLFPFNAMGNMKNRKKILEVLNNNRIDCLISTYTTTVDAAKARGIYYSLGNEECTRISEYEDEVRFTTRSGMDSTTISAKWISNTITDSTAQVCSTSLSRVGVAHLMVFDK